MKKLGKTLRIQVTVDDIANGRPVNAWSCPIALAVARRVGVNVGDKAASGRYFVGTTYSYIRVDTQYYSMPLEGITFMKAFDAGHSVKPIALSLQAIN